MNCTHYIKCGVNSSIYNSGCWRRSVAPWVTVLSWHTEFTKRVLYKFTFLWFSVKQSTMHRPTSHLAHLYTVPFLWLWEEHRRQRSWNGDFLASVCYGDSRFVKQFLHPHLAFQPIWGWGDLGSFQLPQSNSSPEGAWNLSGLYLAPHEDNSVQQLSIANNYNGLP